MYMNNNPFGGLPQYGQQQGMGQMPGQMQPMQTAGPGGFAGQMPGQQMTPPIMQGMPGQQGQMPALGQDPALAGHQSPQHHGMFGGPLGKFAPLFGLAGLMSGGGGSSMLPFLLGGLGGSGLFSSLLNKHHD